MPSTNRKCCRSCSRSVILLLVWAFLTTLLILYFFNTNFFLQYSFPESVYDWVSVCISYTLMLSLPLVGWIAESWLGRYRTIILGFIIATVGILLQFLATIMIHFEFIGMQIQALLLTSSIANSFGLFGALGALINQLPFLMDQMIGASAEELGSACQWYWWAFCAGNLTFHGLDLLLSMILNKLTIIRWCDVQYFSISCVSILLLLMTDCYCHKWFEVCLTIDNPIKLIFRVLNYARKTKYPQRRSALTYLDEEHPSRLDFGKNKFGGPFTEEEVEDVKTFLRLLPLFIPLLCAASTWNIVDLVDYLQPHIIPTTSEQLDLVMLIKSIIQWLSSLALIPAYQFILQPMFSHCIPSLLKRIGAGVFLSLVSTLLNLTLDTVGHLHDNTTHCMFDYDYSNTLPIPVYWVLISDILYGVAVTLVVCSTLEFVLAQSPNKMRGVFVGVTFSSVFLASIIQNIVKTLVQEHSTATPSCGFYYYLVQSLTLLLSLVPYIITAKWYKLRERERHINIQAIVEEHYERYFDQEEEYMRQAANARLVFHQ